MFNETLKFHKHSAQGQEMGSLNNQAKALRCLVETSALKVEEFTVREENTFFFPPPPRSTGENNTE